jgi:hypothetical protein
MSQVPSTQGTTDARDPVTGPLLRFSWHLHPAKAAHLRLFCEVQLSFPLYLLSKSVSLLCEILILHWKTRTWGPR